MRVEYLSDESRGSRPNSHRVRRFAGLLTGAQKFMSEYVPGVHQPSGESVPADDSNVAAATKEMIDYTYQCALARRQMAELAELNAQREQQL